MILNITIKQIRLGFDSPLYNINTDTIPFNLYPVSFHGWLMTFESIADTQVTCSMDSALDSPSQ
jgi:hypothetical protein